MGVKDGTRQFVRERAKYLCEYCHSPERSSSDRFTIDHLVPQSLGGSDADDNLALACRRCNERRYNFTTGVDAQTQQQVALFNPRQQRWVECY
ncbi:MAG: HNH endonuclease signature motif containing protein [Nostoc sp.]